MQETENAWFFFSSELRSFDTISKIIGRMFATPASRHNLVRNVIYKSSQNSLCWIICIICIFFDFSRVASSEFTEFIFKDLKYEKPYFSTYLKTSLFTSYLIGFLVYQPWRDECRQHSRGRTTRDTINGQYQRVQIESEEENFSESDSQPSTSNNGSLFRSLSSPLMVPANIPECHSGKSSGTEETESDVDGASSSSRRKQRVRFRQMAEGKCT